MEIKKNKTDHLDGFVELIKAPNLSQNKCCICSDILSMPSAQSMLLEGLSLNAIRFSKLAAETKDEYYASLAEANRELWRKLRVALELDEPKE